MKIERKKVRELDERYEPYVIATVVRTVRPSSATVGDKAIIMQNGTMEGFIGGQCTQGLIVEQALQTLAEGKCKLIRVTPEQETDKKEGIEILAMTCTSGGTVELFLEPKNVKQPLFIVGNSPVTEMLQQLAPTFSFVPELVSLEQNEPIGNEHPVQLLTDQLENGKHRSAYAVVATMGLYDVEGLIALHGKSLNYLGLVASPKRWETIRADLVDRQISDEFINFITAPAGFDIGARRGEEIALSILTQLIELRRRNHVAEWKGSDVKLAVEETEISIDPVCGMSVNLNETTFRHIFKGETYGFCCPNCLSQFVKDPEMYVEKV